MAKIINLPGLSGPADHLICAEPLDFRLAEWGPLHPALVHRHQAETYERQREADLSLGRPLRFVPSLLSLRGSLEVTCRALFRARQDRARMGRIYLLAGLTELATRVAHDLLRTDLVRRLFIEIKETSAELNLRWPSHQEGFLLPLPENLYPPTRFQTRLGRASSYKELIKALEEEVILQFDLMAANYVFYLPLSWR